MELQDWMGKLLMRHRAACMDVGFLDVLLHFVCLTIAREQGTSIAMPVNRSGSCMMPAYGIHVRPEQFCVTKAF